MTSITESKNTTKKVNMSEVEGSASNVVVNWWGEYDIESKTPAQVLADVKAIIPQHRHNEPKVQGLFKNLAKARNVEQSAIAIGNFVLSGDHLSTLHGFKERDRKFMKNFGHSR